MRFTVKSVRGTQPKQFNAFVLLFIQMLKQGTFVQIPGLEFLEMKTVLNDHKETVKTYMVRFQEEIKTITVIEDSRGNDGTLVSSIEMPNALGFFFKRRMEKEERYLRKID